MQPILANSCALATTTAEVGYRIDRPIDGRRGARIIALDDQAAALVRRIAQQPWNAARFFTLSATAPPSDHPRPSPNGDTGGGDGTYVDMVLRRTDGTDTRLREELADADVAVMVATTDANAAAADVIGHACARRGIMTAGLILGDRHAVTRTVAALRPHAQTLLATTDDRDVTELLTALRA